MQNQTIQTRDSRLPLVSFIIPVYDVPVDMLRECIKSITSLSLRAADVEMIIIDDGSENMVLPELGKLADKLIYIRQKNQGVSVARNMGLRMAQGLFIQFVDGDDLLLQTPYEHVLDLVRYSQPDVVMYDFTEQFNDSIRHIDEEPVTGSQLMLTKNIHGSVWGYVFRRSILDGLQFTPGVKYGEDEEFTARLLLNAKRVFRTTARAYQYRRRDTSATNKTDTRSLLRRLNDSKEVIFRLKEHAASLKKNDRAALTRRIAQLTMDYIYNVIVLTRSRHYLDRRIEELKARGLFPLPDRDYTMKYKWFRRMTNSSIGLTLLTSTLPFINRER